MKTRASICRRKARYASMAAAEEAARASGLVLRGYACERCFGFHLTSRTKGRRVPRSEYLWEREPVA